MDQRRIITVLGYLYLLVGCVSVPQISCSAGEERSVNELLYFGTAKPNGTVSSTEWEEFLLTSVSPRFPKGFTFWQTSGQWQNSDRTITRETSFVVSLVHLDDDRNEIAVSTIVSEYKLRFNQEAVLRVKNYVCMSF
jgi:hypothetical protein